MKTIIILLLSCATLRAFGDEAKSLVNENDSFTKAPVGGLLYFRTMVFVATAVHKYMVPDSTNIRLGFEDWTVDPHVLYRLPINYKSSSVTREFRGYFKIVESKKDHLVISFDKKSDEEEFMGGFDKPTFIADKTLFDLFCYIEVSGQKHDCNIAELKKTLDGSHAQYNF
jgi:hypothetical protein